MFEIITDPSRKTVRAKLSGLMSVEEVQAFSHAEQAAVRDMGLASGEFCLLVETAGNLVQTQEVVNAFMRLIVESPVKAKRIAIVRDGVLTRMQTRRVVKTREGAEVFDNMPDAEAWLAE